MFRAACLNALGLDSQDIYPYYREMAPINLWGVLLVCPCAEGLLSTCGKKDSLLTSQLKDYCPGLALLALVPSLGACGGAGCSGYGCFSSYLRLSPYRISALPVHHSGSTGSQFPISHWPGWRLW